MVLEKILESPLDCKEIQPVHSEGDHPSLVKLIGLQLGNTYKGLLFYTFQPANLFQSEAYNILLLVHKVANIMQTSVLLE